MSQSNQPLDQFSRQKAAAKTAYLKMQSDICAALENADGKANFSTDAWKRIDPTIEDAGGGISRIITDGAIFEKGGVNFSEVYGTLPREMSKTLVDQDEPLPFYAVGTSLVIHPLSPQVPTIHANFRLITTADRCWVGGGIDLTPYVYNEEVFHFFHSELKKQCDQFDPEYYPAYKKHCDKYFFIPHRHETRGIGGIFFDYLGREDQNALPSAMEFAFGMAAQFNDLYLPIVEQTRNLEATAQHKKFQLIRRGRYVEFNLVHDRGTLFGLKTGGRIESILMSLPPHASWEYDYKPVAEEAKLLAVFQTPVEWAAK